MYKCDDCEELYDKFENHENRIRGLEIKDAQRGEQISSLIQELRTLAGWIKVLVGSILIPIFLSLIGFVIWYIQSLPR